MERVHQSYNIYKSLKKNVFFTHNRIKVSLNYRIYRIIQIHSKFGKTFNFMNAFLIE